nr:MAG: replication associated protein [Cressdnaviricota sp.]
MEKVWITDKNVKSRRYCFTINNYLLPENYEFKHNKPRFCIWQHEVGEEGTEHTQGYVEFDEPYRWTSIKNKWDGFRGAHFEACRGSQEQNIDYCSKEDTRIAGPFRYGTPGEGQGTRSDLTALVESARKHKELREVALEHPEIFIRNHGGITKFHNHVHNKPRKELTLGCLIYGPPGSGKTTYAYDMPEDKYWKYSSMDKWWDGYNGEELCILDEFKGHLQPTLLNSLMDKTPFRFQNKGGALYFNSKKVIIISNFQPIEWWGPDVKWVEEALYRRIQEWIYIPRKGKIFKYGNRQDWLNGITNERKWEDKNYSEPEPEPEELPATPEAERLHKRRRTDETDADFEGVRNTQQEGDYDTDESWPESLMD